MRASVFLITKGDDGTERVFAEAEAAEREGCFEYSFAKDGSRFRIRTGSCAYIARKGNSRTSFPWTRTGIRAHASVRRMATSSSPYTPRF